MVIVTALVALGAVVLLLIAPIAPQAPRGAVAEARVRDLAAIEPVVTSAPSAPATAPGTGSTADPGSTSEAGSGDTPTPPRLMVVSPATLTERTRADISRLRHVWKTDVFDGGVVKVAGVGINLIAVDPARFRAWTSSGIAGQPALWSALAAGELVADGPAARRLGLVLGSHYQVDGGPRLRVAASATFGLPGVDGVVSQETGRRLGLLPGVALLVHAPRKAVAGLRTRVDELLGPGAQVVTVGRPAGAATTRKADGAAAGKDGTGGTGDTGASTATGGRAKRVAVGRPASYLELYRRAAQVCPGLSWTVLAAIGQVESSHGRNNGPSSAGAQGPMQFMPATWKAYGVDGDGDGVADIWSPYDAVPGAANYLCANGAGQGGRKLEKAVWFYNHSWSYVAKVMAVSRGYAAAYP
ncbi:lytic murein transglycosylase [Streptosporangium sp. DT93]